MKLISRQINLLFVIGSKIYFYFPNQTLRIFSKFVMKESSKYFPDFGSAVILFLNLGIFLGNCLIFSIIGTKTPEIIVLRIQTAPENKYRFSLFFPLNSSDSVYFEVSWIEILIYREKCFYILLNFRNIKEKREILSRTKTSGSDKIFQINQAFEPFFILISRICFH